MAYMYEQSWRSAQGVLAEANLARLTDVGDHAGIVLGAFDSRILGWLANYEPETCAAITGLISRAHGDGG